MYHQSAFTLPELLVAMAVLTIVCVTAVPGFTNILMNIRMGNAVNQLVHTLYNARQNANATGTSTALCATLDGRQCTATNDWTRGWLLFANNDDDDPPQLDPDERLLDSSVLAPQLRLYANRPAFIMRRFGLRTTNGTLFWCDPHGATQPRAVVISFTGKPRISSTSASGAPLNCPDPP